MQRIYEINQGLQKLFPNSNNPFQIITRLAEECGELAAQVNHFEDSGVKRKKHGSPDRAKLAKEVQDVIRCALQIATHYQIESELALSIEDSLRQMRENLFLYDSNL